MSSFVEDIADEEPEEAQQQSGDGDDASAGNAAGTPPEDSSEEEDDSDDNEYDRTDGFVVDEDEVEEDEEDGAAKRRKKRKKRRRVEETLAEGDYELLEDAGVHRQRHIKRRIRRIADDDDELDQAQDQQGLEDDGIILPPTHDAARRRRSSPSEEHELDFDEDDDFIEHDLEEAHQRRRRRSSAIAAPAGVSSRAYQEALDLFDMGADDLLQDYETLKAMREAQVQGVGEEQEEEEEEEEEESEMEEEEEGDDEGAVEARAARAAKRAAREEKRRRRQASQKKRLDPEVVKRAHLTDEDMAIRETDAPERHQLALRTLPKPTTTTEEDERTLDWQACASWVYDTLLERVYQDRVRRDATGRPIADVSGAWEVEERPSVCRRFEGYLVEGGRLEVQGGPEPGRVAWEEGTLKGGITNLGGYRGLRAKRSQQKVQEWRDNVAAQEKLKSSIASVVELLWSSNYEVPVIGMFCKEVAGELLAFQREDEPGVVSERDQAVFQQEQRVMPPLGVVTAETRTLRRWDVLWCVYTLSLRWRQLQRLKAQRRRVVEGLMQDEATVPELVDRYQACLTMLDQASSSEELRDVDLQLQLVKDVDPRFSIARLSVTDPTTTTTTTLERTNGTATTVRRPTATSSYMHAKRQRGLDQVLEASVLPGVLFAQNVVCVERVHVPPTPAEVPSVYLPRHADVQASDADIERSLQALRHIAACELAACAAVRKELRRLMLDKATISTMETEQGAAEFDAFHKHASVRRLRNKPISEFIDGDQYLHVVEAQSKGLITVELGVNKEKVAELLNILSTLYKGEEYDDVTRQWNELREVILEDALKKYMLPNLSKELHVRLLSDARGAMIRKTQNKLWRLATEAPVRLYDDRETVIYQPTIAAACWGPGRPPTTFVLVDHHGTVMESLSLAHFSGDLRPKRRVDELEYDLFKDPILAPDAVRLRDWLLKYKPAVMLVGTSCPEAKDLKKLVDSVRDYLLENMPKELARFSTGTLDVKFVDDLVAGAWQQSTSAHDEFASSHDIFRRAVGLARTAIDPLGVLAACCGDGREVLSLDLHPMQHMAPAEQRMVAYQQTMVSAVAQMGFRINAIRPGHWLSHMLQFVPGLGPRKAAALLKGVAQHGSVFTRAELLQFFMGGVVFRNVAPYIVITTEDFDQDDWAEMDPLDSMRVHPLQYKLAHAVAAHALHAPLTSEDALRDLTEPFRDGRDPEDRRGKEEIHTKRREALRAMDSNNLLALDQHIQSNPTAIEPDALALHNIKHPTHYIEHLLAITAGGGAAGGGTGGSGGTSGDVDRIGDMEDGQAGGHGGELGMQEDGGNKVVVPSQLASMVDISFEMYRGYEDLRDGSNQLKEDDIFHLVLGDRHRHIQVGKPLEVRVLYANRDLAVCTIPDIPGLTAQLPRTAISSSAEVDPRDVLRPGDVHLARITDITHRDFSVKITTRSTDLLADDQWEHHNFSDDLYYVVMTQQEREELLYKQTSKSRKKTVVLRNIKNPHYVDMGLVEVVERLRGRQDGDFLFSPEGVTRLRLTIRLFTNTRFNFGPVMQQWTVKEEGPVPAQPALRVRLKGPLRLTWCRQDFMFDDLDELVARFVEPYMDAVRTVFTHRKFEPQRWEDVQDVLRRERQSNRMAVYRIGLSSEGKSAGMFYFGWINNKTPYREYFGVLPEGKFYYAGAVQEKVKDLDQLIDVFKRRVTKYQAGMDPGRGAVGGAPMMHRTPVHTTPAWQGMGGGYGATPAGYGAPPPPPGYGAYGGQYRGY